ncbi:F-box/RNI/FBD-like domain protein, partial [Trifolium medium]|nr:F-box/RNI/FBD-like domain protein [Trifolium medium]
LCGEISVNLEQSSAVRLPSLKTLQLDISNADVNSIDILLSACPIIETLKLSFSTESFAKLRVPSSLKSFKFTVENDIEACLEIDTPGLKYLSLTNITHGDATFIRNLLNVEEAYLDVFSATASESFDPDATPQLYNYPAKPESVPDCLISHLTFIHFKGYQGNSCEMEFASYVLRYGIVLKTLLISGFLSDKRHRYDKYRLRREFSNMPRCSTVCQVKLD